MKKKDYKMIAVDPKLHEELKRFCVMNGYTINGLVTKLAREYMGKNNQNETKAAEG